MHVNLELSGCSDCSIVFGSPLKSAQPAETHLNALHISRTTVKTTTL